MPQQNLHLHRLHQSQSQKEDRSSQIGMRESLPFIMLSWSLLARLRALLACSFLFTFFFPPSFLFRFSSSLLSQFFFSSPLSPPLSFSDFACIPFFQLPIPPISVNCPIPPIPFNCPLLPISEDIRWVSNVSNKKKYYVLQRVFTPKKSAISITNCIDQDFLMWANLPYLMLLQVHR